ncbi:hypothetical protein PV327_011438 [Microctonus hyperodae]|uniref:Uncharacterized protein n=1 Tax=Microctonus hyperodae TaxID=165561 RepID=A0AA39KQ64_MICHY|nr:hypothetical protein PV327_011438 [Microctonus hyperodae]
MKRDHKELNSKAISYSTKCSNYFGSQCKGDASLMTKGLNNIPYHCYNIHDNCGEWCRYKNNPDTYKHSVIGDGLVDQDLFEYLKCLFGTLAKNTSELCQLISTNPNESLNYVITNFAPKSRMYGMSASGSQRTACAINKHNDGQKYCVNLNVNLTLSPETSGLESDADIFQIAAKYGELHNITVTDCT